MRTPIADRSNEIDQWRTLLAVPSPEGIDIASLPEHVQAIVRARPDDFADNDAARIDTEGEARRLLERLLGTEPDALLANPTQSLQNLDMGELMALLIEWLKNDGARPEQGAGGGRDVGQMGGPSFSGSPQPVRWNPGRPSNGTSSSGVRTSSTAPASGTPDVGSLQNLSAEQRANAQTIIQVGREMGASDRDIQIALMTAMQESGLKNLNYGDRDSLGLFQQRPSQGWGTPAQVTDPRYAATKFYEGLFGVSGRDNMRLTQAAQAVQRSAFPEAYAKHEGVALALLQNAAALA